MGDTDGSSGAAQGALSQTEHPPESSERPTGFFARVIDAFSPSAGTPLAEDSADGPQQLAPQHGLINLRRMRVEDVAIPKADIIAVPQDISLAELVDVFKESGKTRLPVYDGTLDTPVGMAHLKDLALNHGFNGGGAAFDLSAIIRPLLFVPRSMSIGVLLTKMQAERRHLALVIDEYGGVDGLATIEDLIEQVVGEIEDEHDTEDEALWTLEKPGLYSAFAKTPLTEFEAEIGLSLTDHEDIDPEEIDTLGGLVFMLTGRVPTRGEVVRHPDGPEFEITDADPRRIKRLRVRLPEHAG